MVVPDDAESSYDKTVRTYRSLRGTRIPRDLIVRHRSRFAKRAGWSHSVERQIVQTGQRLYPRWILSYARARLDYVLSGL